MRWIALASLLLAPLPAAAGGRAERLTAAAERLVAALPEALREEALHPFDDEEREDIRFAPLWLDGVRHDALSDEAASLAEQLLALSLSPRGLEKLQLVRRNEILVAKHAPLPGFVANRFYDPGRYLVAVFGTPGQGPWGYRYEGHHLSLDVTVAPGATPASTPLFLGAQPRVVPPGGPDEGAAVLGEAEAAARALLAALPEPLRAQATLPYEDDRALMLGQVRRITLGAGVGVARGEAPAEAQAQFDRLLESFTGLFADEIATARQAEIDAAGRDALRFAWAAPPEPASAFYLRLQGPRTLIEVDNTTDGDHVHAVWHDGANDFGDDLLAAHYRAEHGLSLAGPPSALPRGTP